MNEQLLTVREVARICRVHEVTIRRQIASGRLKAVRIGRQLRVRSADAAALLTPVPREEPFDWEQVKPLEPDDPFFDLIGIVDIPEIADLSTNKHKYIAEAYAPRDE